MFKRFVMAAVATAAVVGIAFTVEARSCQTQCSTLYGQTTCNTYCW